MKKKLIILIIIILLSLYISGCDLTQDTVANKFVTNSQNVEVDILATADLHSFLPDRLAEFIESERKNNENITLVDAGDFFDSQSKEMSEWATGERLVRVDNGKPIYETIGKKREGVAPIVKEMGKLKYDAIVIGNHEIVANDKIGLDNLILDFDQQNVPIISANIYKSNGENYTKPYIIKKISTTRGDINLGILGLTIKEVGEKFDWVEGEGLKPAKSRELKDLRGYEGELYMNDLVEDAKKWIEIMKKDNVDIIVAVVHSGEKPKKPKNPGNRIQELAKEVEDIDAIVAGHTHKEISQHTYSNKSGDTVIVTQPGKNGECISKINFKLKKDKDKWVIIDKSSNIVKFE